jgi:hypothetical protein
LRPWDFPLSLSLDLSTLGAGFVEEEVWTVIKEMAPDKAPGPDGFTARFFQVAWLVIRHNLMSTFDAFWRLDTRHLHGTNDALMVLLPKSADAVIIRDFQPIALIHLVGKLITKVLANRLAPKLGEPMHSLKDACKVISKVLANRLAPKLGELVHVSQNAFIKGCLIHDIFKLVQASAKQLHARKVACLLLKVDITRAFRLYVVAFPLASHASHGILQGMWHDWVSALLSSASIKVLLNGAWERESTMRAASASETHCRPCCFYWPWKF